MTPFVLSLYEIAVEDGSTATLEGIRNACLEKFAAGEGRSLVSSSVNGKSFSFNISKPADLLFSEVSQAIRLYRDGITTTTQIDFSGI